MREAPAIQPVYLKQRLNSIRVRDNFKHSEDTGPWCGPPGGRAAAALSRKPDLSQTRGINKRAGGISRPVECKELTPSSLFSLGYAVRLLRRIRWTLAPSGSINSKAAAASAAGSGTTWSEKRKGRLLTPAFLVKKIRKPGLLADPRDRGATGTGHARQHQAERAYAGDHGGRLGDGCEADITDDRAPGSRANWADWIVKTGTT